MRVKALRSQPEGFADSWKDVFGEGTTVEQARKQLMTELGGKEPSQLFKELQTRLWDALAEHLKKSGKDIGVLGRLLNPDGTLNEAAGKEAHTAFIELMKTAQNGPEKVILARLVADATLAASRNFVLRAAQGLLLTEFAKGNSAIVEAGGGKTEGLYIDQLVHHAVGDGLFRGEINVENSSAANKYVTEPSIIALSAVLVLNRWTAPDSRQSMSLRLSSLRLRTGTRL